MSLVTGQEETRRGWHWDGGLLCGSWDSASTERTRLMCKPHVPGFDSPDEQDVRDFSRMSDEDAEGIIGNIDESGFSGLEDEARRAADGWDR